MGGGNRGTNITVRARSDGRREFFQHDDRETFEGQSSSGGGGFNNRSKNYRGMSWHSKSSERGNYIPRGGRRGQRGSSWRGRSSMNRRYPNNGDEDVDMGSNDKGGRYHQQFYKRNRGLRKINRSYAGRPKSSINNNSGWHKVTIHNVDSTFKDEVMSTIKDSVNDLFIPILFEEEGKTLVFYLEKQFHIAKAILTLSGRLRLSNDKKIIITCSDTTPPSRKLTESQIATILKVMSDRYSVEMKRLDLKNFHNDPTLIQEQIFCPLHRDVQILAVLDIIVKNIPDVEEIDFSSNQINSMNDFEYLKECPHLKCINLENNKLKIIENFSAIKYLPITELNLQGNLIKEKYYDPKSYRIDVAKYFPKLKILDGSEVDRPIGFAVESECITVPKSRGSFFCNEEVKPIVTKFIEQYYQVYESDNRRNLEAAYTEDSYFSLTANFHEGGGGAKYAQVFLRENRNLYTITTAEKKHRLLAKGREDVIESLCRLPIVSHDPNSFILDIPFAKPQLIHVMLMGVFKQTVDSESPIRSFTRSLVIVPVGDGFCICNEELFVTGAKIEQIRKAFKTPVVPVAIQSPPPAAVVASPSAVASPSQVGASSEAFNGLTPMQVEMINQFMKDSKMLPEYCRICLEQQNWNYTEAGNKFISLHQQNKIPMEYFGRIA